MVEKPYEPEYRWVRHRETDRWTPGLLYGDSGKYHVIGIVIAVDVFEVGPVIVPPTFAR